jgi:BirA family biotin operon repressor/biotin-[acetyl-CoA-carboxylase] ligase
MTHTDDLTPYLQSLSLGAWRYFPSVGSTNDIALAWAREDAPDWALVVADAQTAGRGRNGRCWMTMPGSSLAISLVLRPSPQEVSFFARFTALGALGLMRALSGLGLKAELKWPNDILLASKKVAGVLVEADWQADRVEAVVIGMGVNITSESAPPSEGLRYPATAVETVLGAQVDRWALLAETLKAMRAYRTILAEEAFMRAWNERLAFTHEWVRFSTSEGRWQRVKVLGVRPDGQLALAHEDGQQAIAALGEILIHPEEG